jgi:hypothetical protein
LTAPVEEPPRGRLGIDFLGLGTEDKELDELGIMRVGIYLFLAFIFTVDISKL